MNESFPSFLRFLRETDLVTKYVTDERKALALFTCLYVCFCSYQAISLAKLAISLALLAICLARLYVMVVVFISNLHAPNSNIM